jgi:hypothetical protein
MPGQQSDQTGNAANSTNETSPLLGEAGPASDNPNYNTLTTAQQQSGSSTYGQLSVGEGNNPAPAECEPKECQSQQARSALAEHRRAEGSARGGEGSTGEDNLQSTSASTRLAADTPLARRTVGVAGSVAGGRGSSGG